MNQNPEDREPSSTTVREDASVSEPREQSKREKLNVMTQETRFTLVQNIIAHPEQLPSLKELDYYNPSKSESTIRNHLEKLIEHDLVAEFALPEDERARDLPWMFYGLTETARSLLEETQLLKAEETLQDIHEHLELTDEIKRYQEAPRPDESPRLSNLERTVRAAKSNTRSVEDQIAIVRSMFEAGIGPGSDGVRTSELEELLSFEPSYRLRTSLNHLEDMNLVEAITPPGPEFFAISERLDEIINGRVEEVAEDDLENLITHMEAEIYSVPVDDMRSGGMAMADGGVTIRSILADEFNVNRSEVESFLREGDLVEKLNAAVQAIDDSDHTSSGEGYGRILFRRPANRYRLTTKAVDLLESSRGV